MAQGLLLAHPSLVRGSSISSWRDGKREAIGGAVALSVGRSRQDRQAKSSTCPGTWLPPRSAFAGFRFPPEVLAVRWYLRFNLSYRDIEEPPMSCVGNSLKI